MGDPTFTPLKTFLINDAWSFHENQIAKTYVLMKNGFAQIWGYITLVNSEASLGDEQRPENPLRASRYSTFPAVKIARLAIDQRLRGRGFGKVLVGWAVNHIRTIIMPNVGCRFVVVDSKMTSISFYEHVGFVLIDGQENTSDDTAMMFFDLAKEEIRIALEAKREDILESSLSV